MWKLFRIKYTKEEITEAKRRFELLQQLESIKSKKDRKIILTSKKKLEILKHIRNKNEPFNE